MKESLTILSAILSVILFSCGKEAVTYDPGIYKPYKQIISPIYAFTAEGEVDGSTIDVRFAPPIGGSMNFDDYTGWTYDPLREPFFSIDKIEITPAGKASIYPNPLNRPAYNIGRTNNSLFLFFDPGVVVVKFSPGSPNGVKIITDPEEAALYSTKTGAFAGSDIVLYSYNVFIKSEKTKIHTGTLDADHPDTEYLRNELQEGDTLVFVKKDTWFRKN